MTATSLKWPLFLTRLSIFYFMLPWQLARFLKPETINNIAQKYYKFSMPEIGSTMTGVLMMALLAAFVAGFKKRLSYGLMFLLHGLGTIMTLPYLNLFSENRNVLFFAALPTLAAMGLLYVLRQEDTLSLDTYLSRKT